MICAAVVSQVSANMLTSPVSGILGLGWDTIATSGVKPFWQVLAETDGLLDEPVMAFQLTQFIDDDTARSSEFGGTFTFGAVNSSLYTGEIDYQNIPDGSAGYWILQMTSECLDLYHSPQYTNILSRFASPRTKSYPLQRFFLCRHRYWYHVSWWSIRNDRFSVQSDSRKCSGHRRVRELLHLS